MPFARQLNPLGPGPYELFTDSDVTQWLIDNYFMVAAAAVADEAIDVFEDLEGDVFQDLEGDVFEDLEE